MSTVANLRAARAAIAIQSRWTTGTLRDRNGSMCALGAVASVLSLPIKDGCKQDNEETYDRLATTRELFYLSRAAKRLRCERLFGYESPVQVVYGVNDSTWPFDPERRQGTPACQLTPAQRHARVIRMFDEAIKEALAEQQLLP